MASCENTNLIGTKFSSHPPYTSCEIVQQGQLKLVTRMSSSLVSRALTASKFIYRETNLLSLNCVSPFNS